MARKNFSAKVKRTLFLWSNGHCMICNKPVTSPNYAHIIPASDDGPRCEFRTQYDDNFIISEKNCLYLCRDCHADIDDISNSKSLEYLFEINSRCEHSYILKEEYKNFLGVYDKALEQELKKGFKRISEYLDNEIPLEFSDDYAKISYKEKMNLNGFKKRHRSEITHVYAEEFSAFKKVVEELPILGIKLRGAVSTLYQRLSEEEKDGDNILNMMLQIMYDPTDDIVGNRIVLYYYFIICEVFKK